ncbi:S8 family peptidase [Candidatus Peregrinibacteria bacterium]|nr:S8 family peptidase [Candidatus Peregrinibacteria bacterium]
MAISLSDSDLADLQKNPHVAMVSPDYEVSMLGKNSGDVSAQAQTLPTGINRTDAELNLTNKGSGIGVAVIDTGINLTHPDLGSVISGANCVTKKRNASPNDDNGHGSHVAGTIAARDNGIGVVGVAPLSNLIAVKVLNAQGSGTWSSVICGIDWVTANAVKYNIKVANMSLGGGGSSDNNCGNSNSDALHKAICRSTVAGVTYVVAAGNSGVNAALSVPAAYDDTVITVSALADSDGLSGGLGAATAYGADDTFASFSNFGSVVDIGAPGVNIYSTWKNGGYSTISGTSMASPHIAGAAALYVKSNPGASWTTVRDGLKAVGELPGAGHTDPSGNHPEPVVKAAGL